MEIPSHPFPLEPLKSREIARLRTFKDWPLKFYISPVSMAIHGFFRVPSEDVGGKADVVQCFACGLKLWD